MNNSSFLPTSIGYIGAFSMVIGFAYYVFKEFDLSWRLIEPLGYLIIAGLLCLPFSSQFSLVSLGEIHLSPNVLRLTSFLALFALPIMIILTLHLHVEKGDNAFLAGAFICLLTSVLSFFYSHILDGKMINFYAVLHSWGALQFITAQFLKNEDLRLETVIEISALMSFLFMGFGLFRFLSDYPNTAWEQQLNSYVVTFGLFAYLLTGILRTMLSNSATDLLLIVSVVGLYYLIDLNSILSFIEIPLSLLTALYVFSKLFMNLCTRERFPIFLILVGATLYAMSIFFQMRSAKAPRV